MCRWSLHTNGRPGLRNMLSGVPSTTAAASTPASVHAPGSSVSASGTLMRTPTPAMAAAAATEAPTGPQAQLTMLVENTLWNRRLAGVTEDIVQTLVSQIFEGIRDHIITQAELKFNCFFLMPIIHKFPMRLRETLEAAFEEDLDNVFDVAAVRSALENRRSRLEKELHQVELIQEKFTVIHHHLTSPLGQSTLRRERQAEAASSHAQYAASRRDKENSHHNVSTPTDGGKPHRGGVHGHQQHSMLRS
jgi:hypothetical protein